MIEIRRYERKDKNEAMAIWNAVVREGIAFPQDEELMGAAMQLKRMGYHMTKMN